MSLQNFEGSRTSQRKMELKDQTMSDWSLFFCRQPLAAFEKSSARLEGDSDPYCSIWTDAEWAIIRSCNNRSFAMDARLRLESLKSGYNSAPTRWAVDGMLDNSKDVGDGEETQEEESALDSVELLDIAEDAQDEENWLYQSPKRLTSDEGSESALRWCRHVLDNPSPETVAACRSLINKLDQGKNFYRRPAVLPLSGDVSVGSFGDQTFGSPSFNTSNAIDNNELSVSNDFITSSYRLQDITDVHIMARLQEASLRQEAVAGVPTPATASRGSTESLTLFLATSVKNIDEFTTGNTSVGLSSSSWKSAPSALNGSACQSPTTMSKQGYQSPKLSRLHQQVTQFKLLKLAQKQATSPGTTRSPLGTSLRSLQAVRNSRSLETDDYQPADSQITHIASEKLSSCWSPSLSAASRGSRGFFHSVKDSLDRASAVKRVQRSHSASPCRIPNPAKVHLSVHGRVYASPDRSSAIAWARGVPSTRR